MADHNERPLISTQHDAPNTSGNKTPGNGCGTVFWGIIFGMLIISFILNPFIKKDDTTAEASEPPVETNSLAPPSYEIQQSEPPDVSEPSDETEYPIYFPESTNLPDAEDQQTAFPPPEPEGQLSELAQQYEIAYFHSLYTDLGTVSFYDFPERDELLENMVYWTTSDEGKRSEINVALERHLLGDDIWHITSDSSDYVYTGQLKDGKPHGFGIIYNLKVSQYDQELIGELIALHYVGHFSEGTFDGYGAQFNDLKDITYAAQTIKDCGFVSDEMGPAVLHYLFNHVTFEGYFQHNKVSGKANHFRFPSYGGELFPFYPETHDIIDGYKWANVYPYVTAGEYQDGKLNGDATIYCFNHLVYTGSMKNDQYDGNGISYHKNGQIEYTGEWKNGVKHGYGSYYDENGTLIYAGEWKNDDYAY